MAIDRGQSLVAYLVDRARSLVVCGVPSALSSASRIRRDLSERMARLGHRTRVFAFATCRFDPPSLVEHEVVQNMIASGHSYPLEVGDTRHCMAVAAALAEYLDLLQRADRTLLSLFCDASSRRFHLAGIRKEEVG